MKTDNSSVALAIFCGCLCLGACIHMAADKVVVGLNAVSSSLDRVAKNVK